MNLSAASETELSDKLSRLFETGLFSGKKQEKGAGITSVYQARFVKENGFLSLSFLYYNILSSLYYAVSFPCRNNTITLPRIRLLIDSFFHFPVEKGSLLLLEGCVLLAGDKEYFTQLLPYLLKIAQENHVPVVIE